AFDEASRLGERFGGNVDGELLVRQVERGDGHAGAVEGDAVTETHVIEIVARATVRRAGDGEPLAVLQRAAEVVAGGDTPHAGDDAGEHGRYFRRTRQKRSRLGILASTRK